MVLLAAAICTKNGKAIISRQFVEMTRSRIEGLLAAFPKLMNAGKQHTFVETESVRYVYQPLEKLYMLLITTKNSNILEDLETLRLFSRVIPEYCRTIDETDIQEHAFDLIFAFDEVVALGYRESVNLAQIRTFTEMESHDEKLYLAVRKSQENDTRVKMRRKAKELQQAKRDALRGPPGRMSGPSGGFGSNGIKSGPETMAQTIAPEPSVPKQTPRSSGKAMKLGTKSKDVDNFVDKLMAEGERVSSMSAKSKKADVAKVAAPANLIENVHIRLEEKFKILAGRDGGLRLELQGLFMLRIADADNGCVRIQTNINQDRGYQLQVHPNVDKKTLNATGFIGLKVPEKPFPIKQDVNLIKWRFQSSDESFMPLLINCWPNDNGEGCDVNIEYELQMKEMELIDVNISIPVPSGVGSPNVTSVDGEYKHDSRKNVLEWTIPIVDSTNSTGVLEFSIAASPDDFFPVNVSFHSTKKSYSDIDVIGVENCKTNASVKHSVEQVITVDKFEIN